MSSKAASPDRGVVYIVSGDVYREAAVRSAESVRAHSPGLGIDLFTDAMPSTADLFDRVEIIENPHRRSKVDYLGQSRFARTLYLDSDTRVVDDIRQMFAILDRFDIAFAHAHARNRKATLETWRVQVPDAFPQLNSGVMLYRRSDAVLAMLDEWSTAFHGAGFSKDQVTLRELIWRSDLRLFVLPPEYNIRYDRYLDFWPQWEATPKILHYAAFHEDPAAGGAQPGRKRPSLWKRLRRRLKNR